MSEDAVYRYAIKYSLQATFNASDELEELLKHLVDFGPTPEDNYYVLDIFLTEIQNGDYIDEEWGYYKTIIRFAGSAESGVVLIVRTSQ